MQQHQLPQFVALRPSPQDHQRRKPVYFIETTIHLHINNLIYKRKNKINILTNLLVSNVMRQHVTHTTNRIMKLNEVPSLKTEFSSEIKEG